MGYVEEQNSGSSSEIVCRVKVYCQELTVMAPRRSWQGYVPRGDLSTGLPELPNAQQFIWGVNLVELESKMVNNGTYT